MRTRALLLPLVLMFTSPVFARGQGLKPISTHMIEVETRVTLHVVDWGGEGDPLLFLPSWASTWVVGYAEYPWTFLIVASALALLVFIGKQGGGRHKRQNDSLVEALFGACGPCA